MSDHAREPVELPIAWHVSERVITRYTNNIVVQNTGNEFVVSFFEIRPPIILGDSTEEMKKLDSIGAECVARIVISSERMRDFIEILTTNYNQQIRRQERKDRE